MGFVNQDKSMFLKIPPASFDLLTNMYPEDAP